MVKPNPGTHDPGTFVFWGHYDHGHSNASQNHDDDKDCDADALPILLAGIGSHKFLWIEKMKTSFLVKLNQVVTCTPKEDLKKLTIASNKVLLFTACVVSYYSRRAPQ